MIGIEAVPAFIYTLMVFTVPKSPRWLLTKKKDKEEAIKYIKLIFPETDAEVQVSKIMFKGK